MRLRTKFEDDDFKLGEVVVANIVSPFTKDELKICCRAGAGGLHTFIYHSIAEVLEEWEDYKPKEPYIKDKKVRKFVRYWADANEVTKVYVCGIGDGKEYIELYAKDDGRIRISLPTQDGVWIGEEYAITELCGEEKE